VQRPLHGSRMRTSEVRGCAAGGGGRRTSARQIVGQAVEEVWARVPVSESDHSWGVPRAVGVEGDDSAWAWRPRSLKAEQQARTVRRRSIVRRLGRRVNELGSGG